MKSRFGRSAGSDIRIRLPGGRGHGEKTTRYPFPFFFLSFSSRVPLLRYSDLDRWNFVKIDTRVLETWNLSFFFSVARENESRERSRETSRTQKVRQERTKMKNYSERDVVFPRRTVTFRLTQSSEKRGLVHRCCAVFHPIHSLPVLGLSFETKRLIRCWLLRCDPYFDTDVLTRLRRPDCQPVISALLTPARNEWIFSNLWFGSWVALAISSDHWYTASLANVVLVALLCNSSVVIK